MAGGDETMRKLAAAFGGGDGKGDKAHGQVLHGDVIDPANPDGGEFFEESIPLHVVDLALLGAKARGIKKGRKQLLEEQEKEKGKLNRPKTWQEHLAAMASTNDLDWANAPRALRIDTPSLFDRLKPLRTTIRQGVGRVGTAVVTAVLEELKKRSGGST